MDVNRRLELPTVDVLSVSNGPVDGGTLVTVTGLGADFRDYSPSSPVACRFGTSVSLGTLLSPSTVLCQAPASAAAGDVVASVANNHQDYTLDPIVFTYDGTSGVCFWCAVNWS